MPFWNAWQAHRRQASDKTTKPIAEQPADRRTPQIMPYLEQRLQPDDYRQTDNGMAFVYLQAALATAARQCSYTDHHITLSTDGWQHAHIYHHMINQAQQARWTMIMPDLTTPVDGDNIPLMMSQPITTCPLAVHPAPIGRQWGFVAMAVAAHQCGKDWIKGQQ